MVLIQDFSADTPDFLPVCTHLGSLGIPSPLILTCYMPSNSGFSRKTRKRFLIFEMLCSHYLTLPKVGERLPWVTDYHLPATGSPRSPTSPSGLPKTAPDTGPAAFERSARLLVPDIALPGWAQLAAGIGVRASIGRALLAVILGVFPDLPSAWTARIGR